MFKKIIASVLATLMFLIVLPTKVLAEEKTDYQSNIKSVTIEEDGEKFLIAYNTLTNEITINGEKIYMEVDYSPKAESVSNYSLFSAGSPTINWSSGRTYNYKIPWKGGVMTLAAAIGALVGGANAAAWAITIVGIMTADSDNTIYLSFTQYESNETYYSNYSGIDYHKVINKNITFTSNSGKMVGPYSGSWFNPVR